MSESTRQDLLSLFPEAEARAVTIPNMISTHYFHEESSPDLVPEILRNRRSTSIGNSPRDGQSGPPSRYLLMVSTIEPRKNHVTLLSAWERLRASTESDLKLVLVGALGWNYKKIVKRFLPWIERGELWLLEDVPSNELRTLYRHAAATVCPSVAEGFDFSGIEAMRCGSPVVASNIKVHHEIFGAAAEYFSPYDSADAAASIERVIRLTTPDIASSWSDAAPRSRQQFTADRILPCWDQFIAERTLTKPNSRE